MNDEIPPSDPFLPIILLAISIVAFFSWQLKGISDQRNALQNTIARLQEPTKQSQQVQSSLQQIATDLLDLAKTDPQAKAVVDKYGIRQNAPATVP